VEETLRWLSNYLALGIETVAVLIVAYGSAEAFLQLLAVVMRPRTSHGERKALWRRYGVWLLLALEFELGADIVRSVISPTWMDIGALGAIAVIRTFLNFFLERDLEAADDAEPTVASEEERQLRVPTMSASA
jgi:uncharacterized membrane protein